MSNEINPFIFVANWDPLIETREEGEKRILQLIDKWLEGIDRIRAENPQLVAKWIDHLNAEHPITPTEPAAD